MGPGGRANASNKDKTCFARHKTGHPRGGLHACCPNTPQIGWVGGVSLLAKCGANGGVPPARRSANAFTCSCPICPTNIIGQQWRPGRCSHHISNPPPPHTHTRTQGGTLRVHWSTAAAKTQRARRATAHQGGTPGAAIAIFRPQISRIVKATAPHQGPMPSKPCTPVLPCPPAYMERPPSRRTHVRRAR